MKEKIQQQHMQTIKQQQHQQQKSIQCQTKYWVKKYRVLQATHVPKTTTTKEFPIGVAYQHTSVCSGRINGEQQNE